MHPGLRHLQQQRLVLRTVVALRHADQRIDGVAATVVVRVRMGLHTGAPARLAEGYVVGLLCYLVKLCVAAVLLGVLEMSIAKMRVFRVPNFLGAALMLGLLGVLLLFVSEGM